MNWKEFLKPSIGKVVLPLFSLIAIIVLYLSPYFSFNLYNLNFLLIIFGAIAIFSPIYLFAIAGNSFLFIIVSPLIWYFVSAIIVMQKKLNSNIFKILLLVNVEIINIAFYLWILRSSIF